MSAFLILRGHLPLRPSRTGIRSLLQTTSGISSFRGNGSAALRRSVAVRQLGADQACINHSKVKNNGAILRRRIIAPARYAQSASRSTAGAAAGARHGACLLYTSD